MKYDVFISHRHVDWALAGRISDYLKSRGISPFLDADILSDQGEFREFLDIGLQESRYMFLLISKRTFRKNSVKNKDVLFFHEIITFLTRKGTNKIFILLIDGAKMPEKNELPAELSRIHDLQHWKIARDSYGDILEKVVNKITHRSNAREYRDISGRYLSIYADSGLGNASSVCFKKTNAVLAQNGTHITGKTTFGDKQSWILDGEIMPKNENCILGRYWSEHESDQGVGTFFLQKQKDGGLTGYWSGYDNITNRPFSGAYIFRRQEFSIEDATKNDILRIKEIANIQLGENYLTDKSLKYFDSNSKNRLLLIAREKGRILGFSFAGIVGKSVLRKDILKGRKFNVFERCSRIGYLKSIAVTPGREDEGIATALVERTIERLEDMKCEMLVSTVWEPKGVANAGSIFEAFHFSHLIDIPEYWKEKSKKSKSSEGFSCPVCGDDECTCACGIWYRASSKKE